MFHCLAMLLPSSPRLWLGIKLARLLNHPTPFWNFLLAVLLIPLLIFQMLFSQIVGIGSCQPTKVSLLLSQPQALCYAAFRLPARRSLIPISADAIRELLATAVNLSFSTAIGQDSHLPHAEASLVSTLIFFTSSIFRGLCFPFYLFL